MLLTPHHTNSLPRCYQRSSLSPSYSPHPKLAPLVRLAYTAPASMVVLCLGSTNILKGIVLCANKLGSYAYIHRNRKNKKNVTLETSPSKNVTLVPCMGTLWNAMPMQANITSRVSCNFGPLHCISMTQGEKKNIKSAHAVTRSLCNFTKHQ